jgi:hypothetical protein
MRIKLSWTNYDGDISGINFKRSISLDHVGKAEFDRLHGMGVPVSQISEEEADSILKMTREEYNALNREKREASQKKIDDANIAEQKRLEEQETLRKQAEEKALLNSQQKSPEDMKAFMESLTEEARKIYPKLVEAKEHLAELQHKQAGAKKLNKALKHVEELQKKLEAANKK